MVALASSVVAAAANPACLYDASTYRSFVDTSQAMAYKDVVLLFYAYSGYLAPTNPITARVRECADYDSDAELSYGDVVKVTYAYLGYIGVHLSFSPPPPPPPMTVRFERSPSVLDVGSIGAPTPLHEGLQSAGGMAWNFRTGALLFSNASKLSAPSHRAATRVAFDAAGTLYVVDGGALAKKPADEDAFVTLSDAYSPNDVSARMDGRVYVSDATHGVLRYDGDGHGIVQVSARPSTAVCVSADERHLFTSTPQGIVRYDVLDDGALANDALVVADIAAPGGMAVDVAGHLYVACATGLRIYDRTAAHVGDVAIPSGATNCAFGGVDRRQLYVASEVAVYVIDAMPIAGALKFSTFAVHDFMFPRCYTSWPNFATDWAVATAHEEVRPATGFQYYPYDSSGLTAADCNELGNPLLAAVGPHISPIGIVQYKRRSDMAFPFPPQYDGKLFVVNRGSWNRKVWIGRNIFVLDVDMQHTPYALRGMSAFTRPFRTPDDDAAQQPKELRPVDAKVMFEGSLLFTANSDTFEEGNKGGLYRISYGDDAAEVYAAMQGVVDIGGDANFRLSKVAAIGCARMIAISATTPRLLYVSVPCEKSIVAFLFDSDGRSFRTLTIQTPIEDPQGIDWSLNRLFISSTSETSQRYGNCLLRIDTIDDIVMAHIGTGGTTFDLDAETQLQRVACDFSDTWGQHPAKSVRIDKTGRYAFVNNGADCNWSPDCTETATKKHTTVQKIDVVTGQSTTFIRGIRNAVGLYVDDHNNLLWTGMGSDQAAGISRSDDPDNIPDCQVGVAYNTNF